MTAQHIVEHENRRLQRILLVDSEQDRRRREGRKGGGVKDTP